MKKITFTRKPTMYIARTVRLMSDGTKKAHEYTLTAWNLEDAATMSRWITWLRFKWFAYRKLFFS